MSTPLTLCLVVLGRHVKSLEFFDVLLGDRPALSPVETFYQRILANNSDEALIQAEQFLSERPLIDYYDEVVLEGLKLAAEDEARGTIDRSRAVQMTRLMQEVIQDLHDHAVPDEDAIAAPEAGTRRIVCIAGRGAFDPTVSTMLVQLLEQGGEATRALPYSAVSREAIATLDLDGVDTIALSYLKLSSTPLYLPQVIRRLRQRAPEARIIVGLWPQDKPLPLDAAEKIGADHYCHSLRELKAAIEGDDAVAPTALVSIG
jgi:hypothetical protein